MNQYYESWAQFWPDGEPIEKTWPQGAPVPEPPPKRCECGGERARTTHSDWCPVYAKFKP